jgi:hypothetical protein
MASGAEAGIKVRDIGVRSNRIESGVRGWEAKISVGCNAGFCVEQALPMKLCWMGKEVGSCLLLVQESRSSTRLDAPLFGGNSGVSGLERQEVAKPFAASSGCAEGKCGLGPLLAKSGVNRAGSDTHL